eukprot:scaffold127457_cov30-Prasinocladus_malaysianus.AAC.2
MSAQIRNNTLDVFVKFPCIPTPPNLQAASRVDPHHRCRNGINDDDEVHTVASAPSYKTIILCCFGSDGQIVCHAWPCHSTGHVCRGNLKH